MILDCRLTIVLVPAVVGLCLKSHIVSRKYFGSWCDFVDRSVFQEKQGDPRKPTRDSTLLKTMMSSFWRWSRAIRQS